MQISLNQEVLIYELIIVGGGPAGMTAAVYAARKLLKTLLISSDIGGQVMWTNGVENYMGYQFIEGDELISKFQKQVNQFPIDQKIGLKVTAKAFRYPVVTSASVMIPIVFWASLAP